METQLLVYFAGPSGKTTLCRTVELRNPDSPTRFLLKSARFTCCRRRQQPVSCPTRYGTELLGATLVPFVCKLDKRQTSASSHPPAIKREIPTPSSSAVSLCLSLKVLQGQRGPLRGSNQLCRCCSVI